MVDTIAYRIIIQATAEGYRVTTTTAPLDLFLEGTITAADLTPEGFAMTSARAVVEEVARQLGEDLHELAD